MWRCPKCGRAFKNTNQDHCCGGDIFKLGKNQVHYLVASPASARETKRSTHQRVLPVPLKYMPII